MLAALLAAALWERNRARRGRRAAAPTGSTCSSTARCPKRCCSAFARWRASPRLKAPSTARSSCSVRSMPCGVARRLPRLCIVSLCRPGAAACAPLSGRDSAATCAHASTRCWPTRRRRRVRCGGAASPLLRDVAQATRRSRRRSGGAPPSAAVAGRRAWRRASAQAAAHQSCWACAPMRSTAAARSRCRCCARRPTSAATYGLLRVFDDAHPALGDWVRQTLQGAAAGHRPGPLAAPTAPPQTRPAARARLQPNDGADTQEREVLDSA